MALLSLTSPHTRRKNSVQQIMLEVTIATFPGLIALTYYFGWGTFLNVLLAISVAIASEAVVLKLRNRPLSFYLLDGSALVTGLLLGLAIPPISPWWLTVIGSSFAIILVKQLYGGLGHNPFNPAMAGYAFLIISFPVEMTSWLPINPEISFTGSVQALLTGGVGKETLDAYTMATPLDSIKNGTRELGILSNYQLYKIAEGYPVFDYRPVLGLLGSGWTGVNLAFLIGGLYLLCRRLISWHIPVSILLALGTMAIFFQTLGLSNASPLLHLLSGGTMLGAFFIATDPTSAATSRLGKLIYGALIGVTIYVIRTWGGFPDAIAFSVILLNLAVPFIDYYTQPRTYGHEKANRGTTKAGEV